jgi:hypothetical protein
VKIKIIAVGLILLSLAYSKNTCGQITTPQIGTEWVYDCSNVMTGGPLVAVYTKDTFIEGNSAMLFEQTLYNVFTMDNSIDTIKWNPNMIYVEDSLVFYWNESEFDTLINFTSKVNDVWHYPLDRDTLFATVINIGNHAKLGRFLDVVYSGKLGYLGRDTIYEKLLGGREYILPTDWIESLLDGQIGGPLRCFASSDLSYVSEWWASRDLPCMFLRKSIGIPEIENPRFTIYPNPTTGSFAIEGHQPYLVEIFDARGNCLIQAYDETTHTRLSPQLYFIKIWEDKTRYQIHKLLVLE